jgi:hypothetical protein
MARPVLGVVTNAFLSFEEKIKEITMLTVHACPLAAFEPGDDKIL